MKNITFLKKHIYHAVFASCFIMFASCNNNNQKPEDTKVVAEERNDEKFNDNNMERDAQFLVDAAEINLETIQLAKLAQQKGSSAHVKELGKMMENTHTKLQRDLTALAKSKMISIPTSPTDKAKDSYAKLDKKSGNDFDKTYADMVVDKHEDAIDIFENATTDSYDTDIKNWSISALSDLRTHLNHAIESQQKLDKK